MKCFELIQPKEKYICISITNKNTKNPKKIIIFSNGEMSNMCGMLPILVDLSSYLKLNIITYDVTVKAHSNISFSFLVIP